MEAFHNDPSIKGKYITRLNEHYKADEIVKGQYWENGKGCAVGCTIHSNIHNKYESELGIPEDIAHLQDTIFESLPNELAKQFPLQFLSAIKVGADLKNVRNLFAIWMLTGKKYGVIKYAKDKKVIQDVADALAKNLVTPASTEEWLKLMDNATATVYSDSKYDVYLSYSAASYSVAVAAAAYFVFSPYSVKNNKSKWYIAASKKLIKLLKNAN